MNGLLQDLRYALRQMAKNRGFTAVVILTLALGIGVNTAIFTLTHAVLLQSLPVAKPGELYRLGERPICCVQTGLQDNWGLFSNSLYRQFKDRIPAFEELSAFQAGETDLSIRGESSHPPEHALGEFVSGNYFSMFGIQAHVGRDISWSDDRPGAPPVAVMSYRFWQEHYGLDGSVIGSAVTINSTPFTVIGVTPPEFFGDTLREDPPDFWIPLVTEPVLRPQNSLLYEPDVNWLYLMGRLRPNARPSRVAAQATVELQQWLSSQARLSQDKRKEIARQAVRLAPGSGGIVARLQSQYSRGLILLTCVSGLVLLIACANIANLFLARGRVLRQQLAVCLALGASRARLIRRMLTESILFAVMGGTVGLALAYAGARTLLALAFRGATYVPMSPDPSLPVLGFTFAVSLFTGVIFGIAPAWAGSCSDPMEILHGGSSSGDRASSFSQNSLVVLQTSLSVLLLVTAGLLARSLWNLENQRFGFETTGRWIVNFDPELAGYPPQRLQTLYEQIREKLRQIPGVKGVSISRYGPMSGWQWDDNVYIEGGVLTDAPVGDRDASWNRIGPQYFETVGTPLLRGRTITDEDTPTSPRVAVVNEAFVRKFFEPGTDPIGRHFGIGAADNSTAYEIVGVAADAKYWNTDKVPAMFFLPFLQLTPYADEKFTKIDVRSNYASSIELHLADKRQGLANAVRRALANVDPNLAVLGVRSFDEQIGNYFNHQVLVARLTTTLGFLALLVASLGIYGVTSYSAARRTSELGVRLALGAKQSSVVMLVLRSALFQVALGLAIGIPGALAVCRVLSSQLYGVNSYDPLVFGLASVLLTACALAAAFIPARRAAKIDPMVALRYE